MAQHLLIVDDENHIRKFLSEYMRRRGFETSVAASCAAAREHLFKTRFDLAILDVLLPDGDGMELLRQLRQIQPHLPVIILTGIGYDENLLSEAQKLGADGFVAKTVPLDQLLVEVQLRLAAAASPRPS